MALSVSNSPPFAESPDLPTPPSQTGNPQGAPSSQTTSNVSTAEVKTIPSRSRRPTTNGGPQDINLFSKFTLFPKLPLEVRLLIWRYSIPRFIHQPTKSRSYPPLFHTLKEACRVASSKDETEMLVSKLNIITHTLDIPSFNLLDFFVASKIRKARDEFSAWVDTTDTIALSIKMGDYVEMLGSGVRRRQMIGDSVNAIIRALPLNTKKLLVILDYSESRKQGKQVRLSDVDADREPQLKPLQAVISEALSLGLLVQRFVVKYKTTKPEKD